MYQTERGLMYLTERVLAYLKEQPGSLIEIGEALDITKSERYGYIWGSCFVDAEKEGLIEWKDGKWHLKKAEG